MASCDDAQGIVVLKQTYSKAKSALAKIQQEADSGSGNVEWPFTCSEIKTLLIAAAAQIKATSSAGKTSSRQPLQRNDGVVDLEAEESVPAQPAQLNAQLSEAEAKANALESALAKSKAELSEVQSRFEQFRVAHEEEARKASNDATSLQAKLADMDAKMKASVAKFHAEQEGHAKSALDEMSSLQVKLAESEKRAKIVEGGLSKENSQLKSDLQKMDDYVKKSSQQVSESQSCLDALRLELDSSKTAMLKLKSKEADAAKHDADMVISLRTQLSSMEESLKATKAHGLEESLAAKTAQAQLADKTAELTRSENALQAKESAAVKATQRSAGLEETLKQLQSELSMVKKTSQAQLADKTAELTKSENALQAKESAVAKAAQRSVGLEETLKQLQSELSMVKDTSEQLRATKDDQIKHATAEMSSLQDRLSESDRKTKLAEARLAEEKLKMKTDMRRVSDSESTLNKLRLDLDASTTAMAELRSKGADEVRTAVQESTALRAKLSSVSENLKMAEAHQSEMSSLAMTTQAQLADKTAELIVSQSALQAKESAMMKVAEQSAELDKVVKQLQSELNRTKAASDQLCTAKDDQIKKASAEVSSLHAQVLQLQSKASGDAAHGADAVASLRAQLSNVQEELKNVESRQSEDSRALKVARVQLAQKEAESTRGPRTSTSNRLDDGESEKTIASLREQLTVARARCQEADQRYFEAEQSLDKVRADLAEKDSKLSKHRKVDQELTVQTPPRKTRKLADEDMLMEETYFTKRPRKDAGRGYLRQSVRRWVGTDFEICWEFKRDGFCPRGARCSWQHPPRDPVAPQNVHVKEELENDDDFVAPPT